MKNSVYQVVDELCRVQSAAEISALIVSRPELQWAALLDTTFDHDARGFSLSSAGLNCFDFPELRALCAVAPHLISIVPDKTVETQISRLIAHCQGRPMLSFIGTSQSLEDVVEAWRTVHMVSVVDEQKMLLRFADTRVLAYLPSILQASQWERMCSAVACWAYFDRFARLTIHDIPGGENNVADIQVDREQLGSLLEASQPDALMALIADEMHDVVPWQRLASERYAMIKDACGLAKRFSVDDQADLLALAVAAYLSEGASNTDPRLTALLGQRAWLVGNLGNAIVDTEIV